MASPEKTDTQNPNEVSIKTQRLLQPAPLPSQEVIFQPAVSQEAIQTQEMLVVPGYQRSIPKKEFYTSGDFAKLIERNNKYASMTIADIKRTMYPTIKGALLPPEARKRKGSVKTLLYEKEEFLILANAYLNRSKRKGKVEAQILGDGFKEELPAATMKPTRSRSRSEPKGRTEKNEILLKSILDILSNLTAGKPEDINRNSRVILGKHLPPKTTIPQIFGLDVTQEELNDILVSSLAQALQKWWDKDPKSVEKVSEVELQIAGKCQQLRQEGYKMELVIKSLSQTLGTPYTLHNNYILVGDLIPKR